MATDCGSGATGRATQAGAAAVSERERGPGMSLTILMEPIGHTSAGRPPGLMIAQGSPSVVEESWNNRGCERPGPCAPRRPLLPPAVDGAPRHRHVLRGL